MSTSLQDPGNQVAGVVQPYYLLTPGQERELLEAAVRRFETWTTVLGLIAAFAAATAAACGGIYFYKDLALRRISDIEVKETKRRERAVSPFGSIATWSTITAGILGFVIALLSLKYVFDNQTLRKLENEDRLEMLDKVEHAEKQANNAVKENISLTKQLVAVQQSQVATAADASKAYQGLIAAKTQLQQVQQQARIIRTLELEVQLVVNTEPTAVDQYPQSPFGLTNVAALFTSDGRTLYLVNDSRTYEYQQFSPTQRKFRFIFHPYTTGDVLGHQVEILREFVRFDSGYSGFIRDSKAKIVLAPADMQLTVKINGLQVRVLNRQIPYDSLLRQEFEISVRDEFSRIPDDYSKANTAQ